MNEKSVKVGVIGAGGRGKMVMENLINAWPQIGISSVFDPDNDRVREFLSATKSETATACARFEDAAADPQSSWTMVFSPNCYHREHIMASFAAGKHVFSEKPLATSIEDCKDIYNAHKKSGLIFATGFVLRYAPIYRKAKDILDSGYLGTILSVAASENIAPDHGSFIMKNWRRLAKFAGPHILEKCCHDLDLLNWFTNSLPSKAASFGGLDLFTAENSNLPEKFDDAGRKALQGWPDPAEEKCPFKSEKDIIDHQTAIMLYRNGVSATFHATLSNAIPERRMFFSCSEGTMIAELYSQSLKYARIGKTPTELRFTGDLHGGGDSVLAKELGEAILKSEQPPSGGDEGLRSSITALAIDEARIKGSIFDLEPVWKSLGQ